MKQEPRIAVIGLGYVGLPLAVAFGQHYPVIGFDISKQRVESVKQGIDKNLEVSAEAFRAASQISFTGDPQSLCDCDVFIITVPTPVTEAKQPDLTPLALASEMVGKVIKEGAIVIYESTVFPGCIRNFCVPILEVESGFQHNRHFFTGYSPERINPGDPERGIADIVKITSGSTPHVAQQVNALYGSIITAGTHLASSIEVAEAAKVIENAQRDLNIAFMNELSIIFHRLGIDTQEVLAAAKTKWNFLPFKPGLVGGHCIGVDPYYLTHCAQQSGYHPEVILAGRRINDSMGQYLAERVIRLMLKARMNVAESNILVLGLTFKENCPDLRNSRVIDLIRELQSYYAEVDIHDPFVSSEDAEREYGIRLTETLKPNHYDAVIVAVGHESFVDMGAQEIRKLCKKEGILYDVKGLFDKCQSEERL
jgi:UDP-N-acetyl-D-galactosamine dehydrogenase